MSDCAVDSSVAVAALVASHDGHASARAALQERPAIVGHAALESFSVLTRLPAPLRVAPAVASDLLSRTFATVVTLDQKTQTELVAILARSGISGGSAYDAVVAFTAKESGLTLITRDFKARSTYTAMGIHFEWLP